MKLWYRFVCAFVAVAVVLCSVRVPDVDADDVIIDGKVYKGFIDGFNYDSYFYQLYDEYRDEVFDVDDYIDFSGFCFKESSTTNDHYFIFGVYLSNGGIKDSAFVPLLDESTGLYNISCTNSYYDAENNRHRQYIIRLSHNRNTGGISFWSNSNIQQSYFYNSNNEIITWNPVTMLSNIDKYKTSNSTSSRDISTYQLIPFGSAWDNSFKRLTFTYDNDFSVDMDTSTLPQQFTITATNETTNYYNYVFYISSSSASTGVQKSFSDSVFIMSSNQWCMKYSWSSLMPDDDDVSISDWIKDSFGRIIDPWGNIFNPEQSYMSRHGSGSSDDGIYYYTLSQQKKCPFYLIKPKDSRAHVIPYSALNLSLNTTYYANIIYLDTTDYGVVPSSNSWGAADTSHNNYRSHPLYNLNLISRFSVYSSTEFSVTSGNFTKDDDGLYDYKDVVDNSNPGASSATISSDDNSVSINNANSYDNSSSVSYINYGIIYHNCSWSGSGSGGSSSGSRPSVPELPEAEFEDLYEQSGNFFDFVADVLDAVGAVPMLFITAAFGVLLFLRIWGR